MSSEPPPPKPLPSAEEIQAYLERSSARTKKRLTLAAGNARPVEKAAPLDRKLPVGRAAAAPPPPASPAAPTSEADTATAWQPFSSDDKD